MKPSNEAIYSSFGSEIGITVKTCPHDRVPDAVEATRKSLLEIAKAKTGQKYVELQVAWQVEGKYFTETVKG